MRALKPAGAWLNSEEPSPVSDVIMTIVSGEPDAPAVAVPASKPATVVVPANASDASPNLPSCFPTAHESSFPPKASGPVPERITHWHRRGRVSRSGPRNL